MTALVISMSNSHALVVGLAFIVVGALIQYWAGLGIDDRRDVADQRREAAENEAMRLGNSGALPRIPEQRTGGSWIAPRGGPGKAEGGAR